VGADDRLRDARQGFTQLHPLVPDATAARSRASRHSEIPAYLRSLGITSAELLPIHAFVDDSYLVEKGLPITGATTPSPSFAPEPRYLKTPLANEFKHMVNQFTPIASR